MKVVGGGSTDNYGYLAGTSSPQLNKEYATWINTQNTALADTCGWSNTEALITEQGSSFLGGSTTTFRNGSSNQGYSDWFVPAMGQMAYMYLHLTEINTLLAKCGGTALPTDFYYWSSSEYSASHAWHVNFSPGYVEGYNKNLNSYVQFCRYITE